VIASKKASVKLVAPNLAAITDSLASARHSPMRVIAVIKMTVHPIFLFVGVVSCGRADRSETSEEYALTEMIR
jgi:hypothetical protein